MKMVQPFVIVFSLQLNDRMNKSRQHTHIGHDKSHHTSLSLPHPPLFFSPNTRAHLFLFFLALSLSVLFVCLCFLLLFFLG